MIQKNKDEIIRIIKYVFSAGSSFVLDLVLFTIFHFIFKDIRYSILICTVLARILSSIYNYLINSRLVFKSKTKSSIIKYYILVVVQMLVSAGLVSLIERYVKVFVTIIKFGVDIVIFIVNYIIQKEVVFK